MEVFVAFVVGAVAGAVTMFFVARKNPKFLGSIEYLEGKLEEIKAEIKEKVK